MFISVHWKTKGFFKCPNTKIYKKNPFYYKVIFSLLINSKKKYMWYNIVKKILLEDFHFLKRCCLKKSWKKLVNRWNPLSISKLTLIISYMELTHLGLKTTNSQFESFTFDFFNIHSRIIKQLSILINYIPTKNHKQKSNSRNVSISKFYCFSELYKVRLNF